jgi:hypothetical protein
VVRGIVATDAAVAHREVGADQDVVDAQERETRPQRVAVGVAVAAAGAREGVAQAERDQAAHHRRRIGRVQVAREDERAGGQVASERARLRQSRLVVALPSVDAVGTFATRRVQAQARRLEMNRDEGEGCPVRVDTAARVRKRLGPRRDLDHRAIAQRPAAGDGVLALGEDMRQSEQRALRVVAAPVTDAVRVLHDDDVGPVGGDLALDRRDAAAALEQLCGLGVVGHDAQAALRRRRGMPDEAHRHGDEQQHRGRAGDDPAAPEPGRQHQRQHGGREHHRKRQVAR